MWYKSVWDMVLPDENKVGRLVGNFTVAAGVASAAAGLVLKVGGNTDNVTACETQLAKGQGCTAAQTQDYAASHLAAPLLVAAVVAGAAGAMLRRLSR